MRRLPAPVRDVFPLLLLQADQLRSAVRAARDDDAGAFPAGQTRLHYLADQLQVGAGPAAQRASPGRYRTAQAARERQALAFVRMTYFAS